jgi:hypothetical protein
LPQGLLQLAGQIRLVITDGQYVGFAHAQGLLEFVFAFTQAIGFFAREHLVQNQRGAEHVAACVQVLASDLFGRHIG